MHWGEREGLLAGCRSARRAARRREPGRGSRWRSSSSNSSASSLWWNWREHRDARWASLARRAREEYRVYSDRSATMSEPKASGSAGIQRVSNAARVSPQAARENPVQRRPVGFGLIGTGMAGGFSARELEFVEGGFLAAVCSRDPDRVRAFAAEHGEPARPHRLPGADRRSRGGGGDRHVPHGPPRGDDAGGGGRREARAGRKAARSDGRSRRADGGALPEAGCAARGHLPDALRAGRRRAPGTAGRRRAGRDLAGGRLRQGQPVPGLLPEGGVARHRRARGRRLPDDPIHPHHRPAAAPGGAGGLGDRPDSHSPPRDRSGGSSPPRCSGSRTAPWGWWRAPPPSVRRSARASRSTGNAAR